MLTVALTGLGKLRGVAPELKALGYGGGYSILKTYVSPRRPPAAGCHDAFRDGAR